MLDRTVDMKVAVTHKEFDETLQGKNIQLVKNMIKCWKENTQNNIH